MKFIRKNNLLNNIVLVNGTARCGKSLISPIIASFENVEIERMEGIFDYISVSHHFGSIETSSAISLLRTLADEYIYASYLSRNTNFRWSDHSSAFKNPDRFKYFRRLFQKEGDSNIKRILHEKPIYQTQGHDQMQFVKLLLEAWPKTFRMIEIIRDPIDQIDAWWRRNWGSRYGVDPMSLTPCFEVDDEAVPFYAFGWGKEYLEMEPMDRIIKMLYQLQFGNRKAYEALSDSEKKQIMVVRYEDFISNTYIFVDLISKFLDAEKTKYTKKIIKKQGCPRIQIPEKKVARYKNIIKNSSSESLILLEEMIEDYRTDWH